MFYVYVIKSLADGTFYKGRTKDLTRRLREHESGKTQSIRIKAPFRLIHVEICYTIEEAIEMEHYLKSGYGREIIAEINADVAELVYAYA